MSPLVTCLCLTHNRREFLPQAIACYLQQTYDPRELVIVATGENVRDLVPKRRDIQYMQLKNEAMVVGAKRNFGCSMALGSIVCHFDDDDWSAPGRVADQVQRLLETGRQVTGYHSLVFQERRKVGIVERGASRPTSGWWHWQSDDKELAAGTSLCYRRDWWQEHPFPSIHMGEDDQFWLEAQRHNQTIASDGSSFIYAVNHKGNLSGRIVAGCEELAGNPFAA